MSWSSGIQSNYSCPIGHTELGINWNRKSSTFEFMGKAHACYILMYLYYYIGKKKQNSLYSSIILAWKSSLEC